MLINKFYDPDVEFRAESLHFMLFLWQQGFYYLTLNSSCVAGARLAVNLLQDKTV